MALAPGTRLGPYDVVAPLGAGGMGEVYRARDTKLGREVALKVLPEALAHDPERLARFEREAKTLASLNHPHIAQVHGLEDAAGVRALVMELVEGPTLADRIAEGPLPLDEALPIARQIAEALEAAHDQGIVHRDLKPANIKVRPDGTVKVLDFGLAKAIEPGPGKGVHGSGDVPNSPTITSPAMTMRGVILGTAAYMSPEQAKGKPVDRRADIWAFGCVLFEMLTGRRAFEGEDVSETLAFVLTKEPDWTRIPPAVPERVQRLVRRTIEKDVRRRMPAMAIARWELEDGSSAQSASSAPAVQEPRRWTRALPWIAAATAGLAAMAMALRGPAESAPERGLRVRMDLGSQASLLSIANTGGATRGLGSSIVVSPDGSSLVFVARAKDGGISLHVRRLNELLAVPLAGTDNGAAPFFSPDGAWIGFFADGKLKKIPASGGAATILCDAAGARGGTWTTTGTIVFAPSTGTPLSQVADTGGVPAPFTVLEAPTVSHRWPQALPDDRGVLFTAHALIAGPYDTARVVVVPMAGGAPKTVLENASFGRYVSSGHLLYVRGGTVFVVAFDLGRLAVVGGAVPLLDHISYENNTGVAQLDVAPVGALAYVDATADDAGVPMTWLDRQGRMSVLRAQRAAWNNPKVSPDGQRIAMDIGTGATRDIWLYDISRDVATRLTFSGTDNAVPVWSADGAYLAYRSNRSADSVRNAYAQRADGAGEAVALTTGAVSSIPTSWHPSGRWLALQQTFPERGTDVTVLTLERSATGGLVPGRIEALVSSPAIDSGAKFSPDGRWLAYNSSESGRVEVYVRPFPGPGGKWQISTAGGNGVEWVSRAPELVYADLTGVRHIVRYSATADVFVPGSPTPWPGSVPNSRALGRGWAVHPDGSRMVIDRPDAEPPRIESVVLMTGLADLLNRIAPRTQ